MSAVEKLRNKQEKNKSMICLGLDLDPKRMPPDYAKSIKGMYEFAMRIVEATSDLVCAYKPNMAFFENRGPEGFSLLRSITERMPEDMPVIIDGKRGDIGNTASFYAEALYDKLKADWVTLNPYMGYDSMRPFLEYKDKGVFILCLTSNPGSKDFQHLIVDGKPLYRVVAEKVDYWNKDNNCGLVVGATQPEELRDIRAVAGAMPILIPGVGAQGGSLEKAVIYGTDNFRKMALINVSRSVLYASREMDFAQRARQELRKLNDTVNKVRSGEIEVDLDSPADLPDPSQSTSSMPAGSPPPDPSIQESRPFPVPSMPEPLAPQQSAPIEPAVTPEPVPVQEVTPVPPPVSEPPAQPSQIAESPTPPATSETPQAGVPDQVQNVSPVSAASQPEQHPQRESSSQSTQAPSAPPATASGQQPPPSQQSGQPRDQQQGQHDRNQRRFDRRHRRDRRHRNNRFRDNRDNRPGGQDQPKPWERSS